MKTLAHKGWHTRRPGKFAESLIPIVGRRSVSRNRGFEAFIVAIYIHRR